MSIKFKVILQSERKRAGIKRALQMVRALKDSFIYYYKSATGICSAFVLCFVFVIKSTFSAIIVNLFLSQRAAYKSNRA